MDEYFEYFSKKMGSSVHRREVPQSSCERYKDKLPPLLISHWNHYGWSGYGEGLFWTVNPAEYEPVINAWLEDSSINQSPPFHVIARGAFGDLYLWQEGTGSRLTLCAAYARYLLKKLNRGMKSSTPAYSLSSHQSGPKTMTSTAFLAQLFTS